MMETERIRRAGAYTLESKKRAALVLIKGANVSSVIATWPCDIS